MLEEPRKRPAATLLAEPVAFPTDGDHVAVMEQPIEDGGGHHVVTKDPSMRQFRNRLTRACVNSAIGRPGHASIPRSVGLSMRQFRDRSARACVYFGVC